MNPRTRRIRRIHRRNRLRVCSFCGAPGGDRGDCSVNNLRWEGNRFTGVIMGPLDGRHHFVDKRHLHA